MTHQHDQPETRYHRTSRGHIAYQISGSGERALVFVPGTVTHIELRWEIPHLVRMYRRLMALGRVLTFDPLGMGASDPLPDPPPTPQDLAADICGLLDAAHVDRCVMVSSLHGAAAAIALAADHPDRVEKLVFLGGYARLLEGPDYPEGVDPSLIDLFLDHYLPLWGTGVATASIYGVEPDEADLPAYARLERVAAAPGSLERLLRWVTGNDVRDLVPAVQAPSLVFGIPSRIVPLDVIVALAASLPNVRYIELGHDPVSSGDGLEEMIAEIAEFVTGSRATSHADRVLAAVLFTDIVGSTERAAELGDDQWRDLLTAFRLAVRREIDRYGGREVNTRGDDFFIVFDRASSAIQCGAELRDAVAGLGVEVRTGIHVGEIEVDGTDRTGVGVHVGARVSALAAPNQVLVTTAAREAVAGMPWTFADAGTHELKGVPGAWHLHSVEVREPQ